MSVVSIATLKTYFQTGDFPTQAQFEDLIDTLQNSSTSIYKRYVALLTQAGTAAPTAVVLENTLGGTLVWTRNNTGEYIGTLSGAFAEIKTFYDVTWNNGGAGSFAKFPIYWNDVNSLGLITNNNAGAAADDLLYGTPIEIRVYP